MSLSATKCQSLADTITALEDALDRFALGEMAVQVQDGSTMTRWLPTSQAKIEARLQILRTQYFNGACPIVLDNDDILPSKPRRALRPFIGS